MTRGGGEEIDLTEAYEVDHLVAHRAKRGGGREYLVRWRDYAPEDDSWEDAKDILDPALIREYEARRRLARDGGAAAEQDDPDGPQHAFGAPRGPPFASAEWLEARSTEWRQVSSPQP